MKAMKNSVYQRAIRLWFSTIGVLLIAFLALIYYQDPMQVFHKSYMKDESYLYGDMRQQAAGIINNFEFDSVILGTSMFENTSAAKASELLGGQFVNISISGSSYYERQPVLAHALRKKNLKTVVYSLDSDSYNRQLKSNDDYPIERFDYLYDRNPFNDMKVYWNTRFMRCIVSFSTHPNCIGEKKNLDHPNAWFASKEHAERFGGLKNWLKAENDEQIKSAFAAIVSTAKKVEQGETVPLDKVEQQVHASIEYVDRYLLDTIRAHPETRFVLVLPPYYRLWYAQWQQYEQPKLHTHQAVVRYLVEQSERYDNIEIYGYEDQDFVDDIANYKDLRHYHQDINAQMLNDISRQQHRITAETVDSYLHTAEEKAARFSIHKVADKIEEYLSL